MTPSTPGVGSEGTTPPDAGVFNHSLVPFPVRQLPGLPTPHETRVLLVERLEEAVAKVRAERTVHGKEDTYALIRSVQSVCELIGDYSNAFKAVAGTGKSILAEELAEAVGEQQGIPMSGMTVPHGSTNIQIDRKTHNEYYIDMPQVLGALAALVAVEWARELEAGATDITPSSQPEQFAMSVAQRALTMMGSAALKVSHVRALAVELAGVGEDALSAVVSDSIRKNVKYDGISVKRTERKPAA
jgi:hypothetical protein